MYQKAPNQKIKYKKVLDKSVEKIYNLPCQCD